MKRSEINALVRESRLFFTDNGWTLPPSPKWDVTDFGLGDWISAGLVLVNLADEPEYCEKLMYARAGMETPFHAHRVKKEDIICRTGRLFIKLILLPEIIPTENSEYKIDGKAFDLSETCNCILEAGQRITLYPGTFHSFCPLDEPCIIGEVSTANDDLTDNVFLDTRVGRYSQIEEDVPAQVRLVSDNVNQG